MPGGLRTQIDTELVSLLTAFGTNNTEFAGLRTKRFNGILAAIEPTQSLASNPLILGAVQQVLSPYCARYQLNFDGIMHLLPGESHQALHRDGGIYPLRHPCPPVIIACMWAQTAFTAENGATCLIPGSHRWEHDHEPQQSDTVSAEMPEGSVLLYTDGVFHGAGENRSNTPRTGISLQYNLAWLRQELNMYLTYPPEVAKTFSPNLQRLIGYESAGPYLGFINDGSPHLVLEDTRVAQTRDRSTLELDAAMASLAPIVFGTPS